MGGSETKIIESPQPPAPSAGETARDIFETRLEFDPLVAAQEFGLQQQFQPQQTQLTVDQLKQFSPQLAQLATDVEAQQQPQRRALQQSLFPQQSQVVEALAGRALEQLQSPTGFAPGEEEAIQGIRGRQRDALTEQLRTRANLGGGLFGGRAQATEQRALGELEQAFSAEDINRRIQQGQFAQQAAIPLAQILFPQVGTPAAPVSPFQFQGAVPSPDVIAQQLFNASRPDLFVEPGAPNPAIKFGTQFGAIPGLIASAF